MSECLQKYDWFCYVCGKHTISEHRVSFFNSKVEDIYEQYFELQIFPHETWTPKHCCRNCYNGLILWSKGQRNSMQFGVPMRWQDPGEHSESSCYVCQNSGVIKLNRYRRKGFVYKGVQSAMLPVPHSDELPVPALRMRPEAETYAFTETNNFADSVCFDVEETPLPILMSQEHLNRLARKLCLSKRKAEILASDLNSLNLLKPGVNVTQFRNRHEIFVQYFLENKDKTFTYCNDINGLMSAMNIVYKHEDWRLFIDSSKNSLKAVLLYYDNSKNPVPIAYGTNTKEDYESIKLILGSVKYKEHEWRVCCDLKVVSFLSGMQGGYVKYGCFLCKWDSRWKGNQYSKKIWEPRAEPTLGNHNIICPPLVPSDKILLPPLHIKLGVVKNFVKCLQPDGLPLNFIKSFFPKLSEAKIKQGILVGPDIKKLTKSAEFEKLLSPIEFKAWKSIKEVINNVLGKHRSPNAQKHVDIMLSAFEELGVHMSTKIHFLNSHMDYFGRQLSTESDEHGEKFHQTCRPIEERYKGKSVRSLVAEVCWFLFDNESEEPKVKRRTN